MTSQPNLSLVNGIACLEMIVTSGQAIGIRPLSRLLDMNHTKVNRLVSTLADIGLIEQNEDRKYQVGPGLHVLSTNTLWGSKLLPISLRFIKPLIEEGLTVAIGVLWKNKVSYLLHKSPHQALEDSLGTYQLAPLETSSIGMILQASLKSADKYEPLVANYKNLKHIPDKFEEELMLSKKQNYAVRAFKGGEVSVGVAIGEIPFAGLAVCSLGLTKSKVKSISKRLISIANNISEEMQKQKARSIEIDHLIL